MLIHYEFKISVVRRGSFELLRMCIFELRFTRRRFSDVLYSFRRYVAGRLTGKMRCFEENVIDDKLCRGSSIHGIIMFSFWGEATDIAVRMTTLSN